MIDTQKMDGWGSNQHLGPSYIKTGQNFPSITRVFLFSSMRLWSDTLEHTSNWWILVPSLCGSFYPKLNGDFHIPNSLGNRRLDWDAKTIHWPIHSSTIFVDIKYVCMYIYIAYIYVHIYIIYYIYIHNIRQVYAFAFLPCWNITGSGWEDPRIRAIKCHQNRSETCMENSATVS